MKILDHIIRWIRSRRLQSSVRGATKHHSKSGSNQTYSSSSNGAAPDSGHRERHGFTFRQVGLGDTVSDSVESWDRYGSVMEGSTIELRAVTASGRIVEAKKLQIICSVCGKAEDCDIRSDISHRPLCRTCQCEFIMPNGSKVTVSHAEYQQLLNNFNTWEAYDHKRKDPGL